MGNTPKPLNMFFWAAMHSPDFDRCRILFWASFRRSVYQRKYRDKVEGWTIMLNFNIRRSPEILIPFDVEDAYRFAHGMPLDDDPDFFFQGAV